MCMCLFMSVRLLYIVLMPYYNMLLLLKVVILKTCRVLCLLCSDKAKWLPLKNERFLVEITGILKNIYHISHKCYMDSKLEQKRHP